MTNNYLSFDKFFLEIEGHTRMSNVGKYFFHCLCSVFIVWQSFGDLKSLDDLFYRGIKRGGGKVESCESVNVHRQTAITLIK